MKTYLRSFANRESAVQAVKVAVVDHSGSAPLVERLIVHPLGADAIVEGEVMDPGLVAETIDVNVEPFDGANIDPKSLEITGIQVDNPLRGSLPEVDALRKIFQPIRQEVRATGCQRAILVGHNAFFDLSFLNAAIARTQYKRSPFHPFSSFDTATLAGLAFGQTVLSRSVQAAGLDWDESEAHSAVYDTEKTAALFCAIVNRWKILTGF